MVDIVTIAFILLISRMISMVFMAAVLQTQFRLFGTTIDFKLVPNLSKMQRRNVYWLRRVLFALSLTIFLGNLIPITIDAVTLFVETSRPDELAALSISYAISNAFTDMLSAVMIWLLYRIAGISAETHHK